MSTTKKYKTILADPPWQVGQMGARGAIRHYDLMTLHEIKKMPIAELADDASHCWLWLTQAVLEDGYDVMRDWGFTPRSLMTWVKPRFTLGNFLRGACEYCLLGTRGKAPVHFRSQPNWTFAPLQDHSHKPEEQYAIIERVSGPGPRLELFARRRQHGWDAWGNEIESDVEIPGYPVPKYSSAVKPRAKK